MSEVSGLITLDALVRKLLVKKKRGNEMYLRYLQILTDGVQELNQNYIGAVKTSALEVNTLNKTVSHPNDYINYISLSVDDGRGRMWTFTKDDELLIT
jgi:hypothetical protein